MILENIVLQIGPSSSSGSTLPWQPCLCLGGADRPRRAGGRRAAALVRPCGPAAGDNVPGLGARGWHRLARAMRRGWARPTDRSRAWAAPVDAAGARGPHGSATPASGLKGAVPATPRPCGVATIMPGPGGAAPGPRVLPTTAMPSASIRVSFAHANEVTKFSPFLY
jgi:hypothetical protein